MRGGLGLVSSCRPRRAVAAALVIAFLILFHSSVRAQDAVGDGKGSVAVSKIDVPSTSLHFNKINLSSKTRTETKSFAIKDTGGLALSVTVAAPSGSPFFQITAGQGTSLIQPNGKSTVTVEFAPGNGGDFSASIDISSDATRGKSSAQVKLTGSAKGSLATPSPTSIATPTPTATMTPTPNGSATPTATATIDVLTYHNDLARTGQNLNEQILTPSNVRTSFGKLFSVSVDGLVDAQPLIKTQVVIPGQGTHNVLYVVTENDSVYAFDSDTGKPLWQVSALGTGEGASDSRGCSQVVPEIGITSTPVIDPSAGPHGTIFLIAMSKITSETTTYFQRLHALDMTTGAEEFGGPVTISAKYPPGPAFVPKDYKERAGLLLVDGQIITTWASHCDDPPYNGWIMAYNESTLEQTSVLDLTPNGSEGAIWQSGGAPAADSSGNIYLLAGNGTFDTTVTKAGFPNNNDFGNGFLKLSNSSGLQVTDFFEPFNTTSESSEDDDLGAGGAMVLPDMVDRDGVTWQFAVGAGKDGNIYLVNRNNMGKWNSANNNNAYQPLTGAIDNGVWSMPAYFNGTIYYGGVNDPLQAWTFSDAKLVAKPSSKTSESYDYPGTTPSISANGTSNAIVWTIQNVSSSGVLHAYDATNLATEFYTSGAVAFGDNKFVTPTIANGKVYVGTPNSVVVFGLTN